MRESQGKGFTVGRVEAFSDGVLAIVITLLVLEIKTPELVNHESTHEAWKTLMSLSPKFVSFFLSFLFIAVFWVNHHRFFGLVRQVAWVLLWLNNLLLLFLCFVPFPTAFLGDHPRNAVAIALFALMLMLAGIVFNLMWRHVQHLKGKEEETSPEMFRVAIRRGLLGPLAYLIAALCAPFMPLLSWIIFLAVPVFYVLPLGSGASITNKERRKNEYEEA